MRICLGMSSELAQKLDNAVRVSGVETKAAFVRCAIMKYSNEVLHNGNKDNR